jgi:hypothetical protein
MDDVVIGWFALCIVWPIDSQVGLQFIPEISRDVRQGVGFASIRLC